ncbi:MAG: hypothetical protein ACLF0P_16220 [Thermoanaerobaculia bacterium]
MGPHRIAAVLGISALLSLVSLSSPGRAQESPFGEPFPLLTGEPGTFDDLTLALPISDEVAVFLGNGRLWRTDGTAEGTFQLSPQGVEFDWLFLSEGPVVWLRRLEVGAENPRSLWRTDGTPDGTFVLREDLLASTSSGYHPGLGLLFFSGGLQDVPSDPSDVDFEPWVSDGTVAGTRQIDDLLPDGASRPSAFEPLGDEMLFLAAEPQSGRRALWRSDGTAEGTRMVAVPDEGEFRRLWVLDSTVYLESVVGSTADAPGRTLWTSDGTTAGTVRVHTFDDALFLDLSGEWTGGRTLWTAEETRVGGPAELWITEGTPGSTVRLTPLSLPGPGQRPTLFVPFRGELYFRADDGTTGLELWKTDGTPEGTRVAFETCPGECSDFVRIHSRQEPGHLLVWIRDEEHGVELRATDGTAEGTELLLDTCPGPCSQETSGWRDFGGLWLFTMRSPEDNTLQLWVTDRTQEGTHRLTRFTGGVKPNALPTSLLLGDHLLFGGTNEPAGQGLWALPIGDFDPPPPAGPWLSSGNVPGFSFQVRITGGSEPIPGTLEPSCIPETACVSGAVPGRSEVFVRVVGPKPNGRLWPTLVKFSTSTVEVWIRQEATGAVRYYELEGARPGVDELPGLFDRTGFEP